MLTIGTERYCKVLPGSQCSLSRSIRYTVSFIVKDNNIETPDAEQKRHLTSCSPGMASTFLGVEKNCKKEICIRFPPSV